MNTPTSRESREARDQRDALSDAERQASRSHPENFKEAETEDKVVEILPVDGAGSAIKGIDPEKK